MQKQRVQWKILGPGYVGIVLAGVLENLFFREGWFQLGSVFGVLWICVGLVGLWLASRELRKGEGYLLVQSGVFAKTRNPAMAAHLFGIMPGLCLLLNTNLGILAVIASVFLFYKHIGVEEMELEDRFGEVYQAYRERVGKLFPYW